MKKFLLQISIALILFSCDNNVDMNKEVYENAKKHLSQNLNKYLKNTVSSQLWENNSLTYRIKNDTIFKTYKIDLETLEVSETDENQSRRNRGNWNEYLSPDGNYGAYINNHNLWIRNTKTGDRIQLTYDGFEDYGYATNNAGWIKNDRPVLKWSPDSRTIATFRQDARGLGEMYLATTNVGHPTLEKWKYTLPGDDKIFEIERIFIDIKTKKITPLNFKRDFQRSTTTDHIADWDGTLLDANFSENGRKLAFISSTRDHKEAHLHVADVRTGRVTPIYKEVTQTYYESGVSGENWRVFFDTNEFLWYSEKDDWGHLYLHDLRTGKLINQITSGQWLVRDVLHVDKSKREIYFTGGGREDGNPYHIYLYKVNFDGSNLKLLTPEKGTHSINPSPNWDFFTTTYSTTTNPPITVLKDNEGNTLKTLAESDISELKENNWQQPVEFNVKARDGETDIYGLMYLPSFYSDNGKYPVLNYIYPGPQAGSVRNYGFSVARRDFQAMAELGFVVVAVDAMGTPGRSKSFHDAYYGNMGDNGIPDNIKAIQDLAKQYTGMNIEKVGIWGHSGGGFASTRAILEYPDFYDVAVSSAGNHDNRNYEADWGEKWQGLLENVTVEDDERSNDFNFNKTNYDNQANQLLAGNLKGKLLLAHGNMDNNVPPYNTLLVVDELIKANKDFDLIIFPNKRHGFGDQNNYFTRRKWDYFVKHLLDLNPPENFSLD